MECKITENGAAANCQNENELYERRNERKRERRRERKEEDPDFLKMESAKRQERREKQKSENPEAHLEFLKSEKQKREIKHRQILNDIFDSLYEENKHTFPTPVSKSLWEKLKKFQLNSLFSPRFSPSEITVNSLQEYRKTQLDFLKNNIDFPHGGSVIFYIKTMVHRPRDQRKLTHKERDYIYSLDLSPTLKKEKCESSRKEYFKEKSKEYYEKKQMDRKTVNLNIRFMKEDPNRVLSVDDIISNPFVSNFCQREEYKINLWKTDKNPEYLEKWREQRQIYEKEVEDLSVEYKENFLRNKWLVQS